MRLHLQHVTKYVLLVLMQGQRTCGNISNSKETKIKKIQCRNVLLLRKYCSVSAEASPSSGQDRPCSSNVWRCGLLKISIGFQALGKDRERHLTLPISFLVRLASLTIQRAVDMGDFAHVWICSCLYFVIEYVMSVV